jgi:hypothetical protein
MNETTPTPTPKAPILIPPQKRWLVNLLVGIGGIFLGRWGIPLPAEPFPLAERERIERIEKSTAETASAVKEIQSNNVIVLNRLAK